MPRVLLLLSMLLLLLLPCDVGAWSATIVNGVMVNTTAPALAPKDINGDGKLLKKLLDTNGDGRLSKQERAAAPASAGLSLRREAQKVVAKVTQAAEKAKEIAAAAAPALPFDGMGTSIVVLLLAWMLFCSLTRFCAASKEAGRGETVLLASAPE